MHVCSLLLSNSHVFLHIKRNCYTYYFVLILMTYHSYHGNSKKSECHLPISVSLFLLSLPVPALYFLHICSIPLPFLSISFCPFPLYLSLLSRSFSTHISLSPLCRPVSTLSVMILSEVDDQHPWWRYQPVTTKSCSECDWASQFAICSRRHCHPTSDIHVTAREAAVMRLWTGARSSRSFHHHRCLPASTIVSFSSSLLRPSSSSTFKRHLSNCFLAFRDHLHIFVGRFSPSFSSRVCFQSCRLSFHIFSYLLGCCQALFATASTYLICRDLLSCMVSE